MGVKPNGDGPAGLEAAVSVGPGGGGAWITGWAVDWESPEEAETEGVVGDCSQRCESMLAKAGRFLAACMSATTQSVYTTSWLSHV